VITGDVATGKTVSVHAAVDALDRTRHQVIYIADPAFGTAVSTSPSSVLWAPSPATSKPS
jgi:type II secretory pathway predicted ATPase ExeA